MYAFRASMRILCIRMQSVHMCALCAYVCILCTCVHSMHLCAFCAHVYVFCAYVCAFSSYVHTPHSVHMNACCAYVSILCKCVPSVQMCTEHAHMHTMRTYAYNVRCTQCTQMQRIHIKIQKHIDAQNGHVQNGMGIQCTRIHRMRTYAKIACTECFYALAAVHELAL